MAAGDNKDFAELLVKSGLSLKFVIRGNPSGRESTILLTADKIKASSTKEHTDHY